MEPFEIYTDGGHKPGAGLGSWAFLILMNGSVVCKSAGSRDFPCSIAAELMAAVYALRCIPEGAAAVVNTDCSFVISAAKMCSNSVALSSWFRADPKRSHFFPEALAALSELIATRVVMWNWVKGHSGIALHNICDRKCRDELRQHIGIADIVAANGYIDSEHPQRYLNDIFESSLKNLAQHRIAKRKTQNTYVIDYESYLAHERTRLKVLQLIEKWRSKHSSTNHDAI